MRRLLEMMIILLFCSVYYSTHHGLEKIAVYIMVVLIYAIGIELLVLLEKPQKWILLIHFSALMISFYWYSEFYSFIPMIVYSIFPLNNVLAIMIGTIISMREGWGLLGMSLLACYLSYRWLEYKDYAHVSSKKTDEIKEQVISLEKYNQQLLDNRQKGQEIAKLEERNRIARELHDSLGHTISSSIMQIEVLKLIEQDTQKKEKLQILQDTLSNGMMDIRQQLHGIYNTAFSLEQKIRELQELAPEIVIKVQNQCRDNLTLKEKKDIYSMIREALTNTMKHSRANQFQVFLKEQGSHLVMMISDNGSQEPEDIQVGMGLSGMKETVEKYKGKMNYYYRKGFHIHIILNEREK